MKRHIILNQYSETKKFISQIFKNLKKSCQNIEQVKKLKGQFYLRKIYMKKRIFFRIKIFQGYNKKVIFQILRLFPTRMSFLLLYVLLIYLANSIDTYLNLTSGVKFDTSIKKAILKQFSGVQYAFIYFEDDTIRKYSNQMVELSRFSVSNKNLTDFRVTNISNAQSFSGIVEGGNELMVWSYSNTSINSSVTTSQNLTDFSVFYYNSSSKILDFLVYRQDIFLRKISTAEYNKTNFFSLTNARNFVDKVIQITYGGKFYHIVFTSLKHVYSIRFSVPMFVYYILDSITKILDLSGVSNSTISKVKIDKGQIVIVQFSDSLLYAFHGINGSAVTIKSNLQSLFGTSVLKHITPQNNLNNGQRVFVFNDKSIRVSLKNDTYSFLSFSQTSFPITNWSGIINFRQSNMSFVYVQNSSFVYGYCESSSINVLLTQCRNGIQCQAGHCSQCTIGSSLCLSCLSGYFLISGVCYNTICPTIQNCLYCNDTSNCVRCLSNYTLDTVSNQCTITSNQSIILNNTNNNTTTTNNQTQIANNTNATTNTSGNYTQSTNNQTLNNQTNSTNDTTNSTSNNLNNTNSTNSNNTSYPIDQNTQNNTVGNVTQTNITVNQTNNPNSNIDNSTQQSNNLNQTQNINNPNTNNSTNVNNNQTNPQNTGAQNTTQRYFTKQIIQQSFDSFDPSIRQLTSFSAQVNSFPASRILLQFLAPLFEFFDDYWYYIYHQDSYEQLKIMPDFLVFMYGINQERIIPDYLTFDNPIKIDPFISSNYTPFTNGQILRIDQKQTYLLENLQQMLFEQYLIVAFILIFVKILVIILNCSLKKADTKHQQRESQKQSENSNQQKGDKKSLTVIKIIIDYLEDMLSFKSILMSLIGSNLIMIVFGFSTQLSLMFSYQHFDNVDIGFTIFVGMVLIFFTIMIFLYEEIFIQKNINGKKIKRTKSKKQHLSDQKKQCLHITYFSNIKKLLSGFIHGFFINYPNVQYILLILTKVLLIYIAISNRKVLRKRIFQILMILYFLAGIILDFLCLLSKNLMFSTGLMENIANNLNVINFIEISCIGFIIIALVLQIIIDLYLQISEVFAKDNKKDVSQTKYHVTNFLKMVKRIAPENSLKQSNIEINSKSQPPICQSHPFETSQSQQIYGKQNNAVVLKKCFLTHRYHKNKVANISTQQISQRNKTIIKKTQKSLKKHQLKIDLILNQKPNNTFNCQESQDGKIQPLCTMIKPTLKFNRKFGQNNQNPQKKVVFDSEVFSNSSKIEQDIESPVNFTMNDKIDKKSSYHQAIYNKKSTMDKNIQQTVFRRKTLKTQQ